MASIRGVLIDLGGVIYQGKAALPGAIEAIGRLGANGIATRFLTNTTSVPRSTILAKLQSFGLPVSREELFTPAVAARAYIVAHDLQPHYLMRPALLEDFHEIAEGTILYVRATAEHSFFDITEDLTLLTFFGSNDPVGPAL